VRWSISERDRAGESGLATFDQTLPFQAAIMVLKRAASPTL
jgi:hypothetical protein